MINIFKSKRSENVLNKVQHKLNIGNGFYVIITTGIENGIFFRLPIRKMQYTTMAEIDSFRCVKHDNNLINYIQKVKGSMLFRLYNFCIGNGCYVNRIMHDERYKNIEGHMIDDSSEDIWLNTICSPVYFERRFKKFFCSSLSFDNKVELINSYSYADEYLAPEFTCNKEDTYIKYTSGKRKFITRKNCNELYTTWVGISEKLKIIN